MRTHSISRLLVLVGGCLLLSGLAWAQVQAQEKDFAKREQGIQLRLLAEEVPETLGQVCLVSGRTRTQAFSLPTHGLSRSMGVASRQVELKLVEREVVLSSIRLPDEGRAFVVVLLVARPAGYQAMVVRADDPAFCAGDVMVLNRSSKAVWGRLGGTAVLVKPGEQAKARPTVPREEGYFDIAFGVRDESGDQVISTTRWPVDQSVRSYLFFFQTPEGRVSYRAVDEFVPRVESR